MGISPLACFPALLLYPGHVAVNAATEQNRRVELHEGLASLQGLLPRSVRVYTPAVRMPEKEECVSVLYMYDILVEKSVGARRQFLQLIGRGREHRKTAWQERFPNTVRFLLTRERF